MVAAESKRQVDSRRLGRSFSFGYVRQRPIIVFIMSATVFIMSVIVLIMSRIGAL